MKKKITKLLSVTYPLKGRKIANKLGLDRSKVNLFLSKNKDIFVQNEEFAWSLKSKQEIIFEIPEKFVNAGRFEKELEKFENLFSNDIKNIRFVIPVDTFIKLEASMRLLSLANQLADAGKKVCIDFTLNSTIRIFLDRAGFLKNLDSDITVLPSRPKTSLADQYAGNSETMLEVHPINPDNPDMDIPELLVKKFIAHVGSKYEVRLFSICSELFDNVWEHSKTKIPGHVALQKYNGKKPHVQVVVSDSGKGIANTLKPVFHINYPKIASQYNLEDQNDCLDLIALMFEKGDISSRKTGGGDGLKSSGNHAVQYQAKITVRQETSQLTLSYKNGKMPEIKKKKDMPIIYGTHVTFEFYIDQGNESA